MSQSLHDPDSITPFGGPPRLSRCHAPDSGSVAESSIRPARQEDRGDDPGQLLGHHVSSLAVVTMCRRGTPAGVLVSSLAPVSTEPPVISFSISTASWAWPALEQAEHIGIHLLAAGQQELAKRFSPDHIDGFQTPLPWQPGPYGVPVLDGCLAWTVAQPKQLIHTGNHVIIVSRLVWSRAGEGAAPLLARA